MNYSDNAKKRDPMLKGMSSDINTASVNFYLCLQ